MMEISVVADFPISKFNHQHNQTIRSFTKPKTHNRANRIEKTILNRPGDINCAEPNQNWTEFLSSSSSPPWPCALHTAIWIFWGAFLREEALGASTSKRTKGNRYSPSLYRCALCAVAQSLASNLSPLLIALSATHWPTRRYLFAFGAPLSLSRSLPAEDPLFSSCSLKVHFHTQFTF